MLSILHGIGAEQEETLIVSCSRRLLPFTQKQLLPFLRRRKSLCYLRCQRLLRPATSISGDPTTPIDSGRRLPSRQPRRRPLSHALTRADTSPRRLFTPCSLRRRVRSFYRRRLLRQRRLPSLPLSVTLKLVFQGPFWLFDKSSIVSPCFSVLVGDFYICFHPWLILTIPL